jgi:hypothetical protein
VRHQLPVTTVTRALVFVGVPVGGTTDHAIYLERSVTHERFSYVGMTEAAASTCAAAMVSAYTNETTGEVEADIEAVHVGGRMWQVNVEVRQTTKNWVAVELQIVGVT